MKFIRSFYWIIFFPILGCTQSHSGSIRKDLKLILRNDSVKITSQSDSIILNATVINDTDSSLILYRFKSIIPGNSDVDGFLPMSVGGNLLSVKNGKNFITGLVSYPPIPLTKHSLGSTDSATYINEIKNLAIENARDNRLIIPKRSIWNGRLKVLIDNKYFKAAKYFDKEDYFTEGECELYLIFSCPVDITKLIPEEIIREDEKKYMAVTYKGIVHSNTIKLIMSK